MLSAARKNKSGAGERGTASIARRISWSFWWRRLVRWILVDLIVIATVLLALWVAFICDLPDYLFEYGLIPTGYTEVQAMHYGPALTLSGINLLLTVEDSTWVFPLGRCLAMLWPGFAALFALEVLSLVGGLFDVRRVRRRLAPLNDLALRAESLGSKGIMDASKIESLEQAIERASVEKPQVSTGVDDLASIEVALNGLLRQMNDAKMQQIRFVSDASHELRTPIAVVQGYVNMLDRWGKDDPEVLEESIAALKAEGAHMQELVEQLLFLARSDSGRSALELGAVNVAALVAEVADESVLVDGAHGYALGRGVGAGQFDERLVVQADRSLLKQALRALVQNAARYSGQGAPIVLDVGADSDSVLCSVRDEGIGIAPADAAHVFERFWRSDTARETSKEGSGLGLAIVQRIVEAHGGTIELVSSEGVGSRFTVRLPRRAGAVVPPAAALTDRAASATMPTAGERADDIGASAAPTPSDVALADQAFLPPESPSDDASQPPDQRGGTKPQPRKPPRLMHHGR